MLSHNKNLQHAPGAITHSKRLGRGTGSGKGGTSGKGGKGQTARAGAKFSPMFEGGQTPLFRRSPKKRGFNRNNLLVSFAPINVGDLTNLGSDITLEVLMKKGYVRPGQKIKLLGNGEISTKVTIHVHSVSAQAKSKVEKAGGTVEIIS